MDRILRWMVPRSSSSHDWVRCIVIPVGGRGGEGGGEGGGKGGGREGGGGGKGREGKGGWKREGILLQITYCKRHTSLE